MIYVAQTTVDVINDAFREIRYDDHNFTVLAAGQRDKITAMIGLFDYYVLAAAGDDMSIQGVIVNVEGEFFAMNYSNCLGIEKTTKMGGYMDDYQDLTAFAGLLEQVRQEFSEDHMKAMGLKVAS